MSTVDHRHCAICTVPLEPYLPDARDPQTGERFDVLRCPQCGSGAIDPIPDDLGRFYGADYYGKRHGFTVRYRCWRRMRLLQRHVARPGRLLDVGCGDGDFLVTAARAGWRTAGVERGERAAEVARQELVVRGSLDELIGLGTFDVITLWHSFEHMTDPAAEMDKIVELLADGGTLLMIVPDFGGIQARTFGRSWYHLDVPRHVHHFTQQGLRDLVERRGLMVVGMDHHEIEYDLFGWLQSALNALLPTPNLFFNWLTRKPLPARSWEVYAGVALAVLLSPLAAIATGVGIGARRGATINVVARKPAFVRRLDVPGVVLGTGLAPEGAVS
jgi:SAM-dependent methyltransferase